MYHIRRKKFVYGTYEKLIPAQGRINLYHTREKNLHMVQMRACSNSGKNKSVPYKRKKFAYGTNESLFQLGEEEICTIQEKKFAYGTNESLFRLRVEEICTI